MFGWRQEQWELQSLRIPIDCISQNIVSTIPSGIVPINDDTITPLYRVEIFRWVGIDIAATPLQGTRCLGWGYKVGR